MPETNATILIPDISGFTQFVTTTELGHSSHAINLLIDAMLNAVGDAFEVSEIEGDAILLIRKGPAPSRKEIEDICLKIFNAFHFQRKWMQDYTICPCGACQAITHLTLKFIVHHGPLAEIKVGRFVKQSGTEMIVAHRLLKNSIDNNEYLLMTEKLLEKAGDDASESVDLKWASAAEEYSSLGKIQYRFALLNEARKQAPEPPRPPGDYKADDTPYIEIPIAANFRDAYMVMMNIPGRPDWMPELEKVEQDVPNPFVGSIHHCKFRDFQTRVSPLRMTLSETEILYAESCSILEMGLSLVHEFVFKDTGGQTSIFATRFMNAGETPVPEDVWNELREKMERMGKGLKVHCESTSASA